MVDYKAFFKGKRITVMGLGLLGRGVGDVAFLAECGAELVVTDLKTREELKESLIKLKKYNLPAGRHGNIKYVLGEHRLEDFRNCDMVLKSAGVPLDSIYIKEAEKHNVPVKMSASLLVELAGIPSIGVTGTRGKSTVVHMIEHILKTAKKKILVGGNVRGVSNLQLLKEVKGKDFILLELDSWQLQGFGSEKISPNISVFTTFFPDHMKYYAGDMKKYFTDKANIFKYQKRGNVLVAGLQVLPFIKKWGGLSTSRQGKLTTKMVIPKTELPKGWVLSIKGEHNIYNATLAVEVAKNLKIKDEVIKKAIKSFKGVPGRLEFIREVRGVKYYNDTTATTPEATIVALRALGEESNIVLIAGGSDKGLEMDFLVREIPRYTKSVILLSGSGTNFIKNKITNSLEASSMVEAVRLAKEFAEKGDIVLLSPAFASFGMFKNEYDRGDQFVKIVKKLK